MPLARLIEQSGGTLPEDAPDRFRDDDGTFHESNINKLAAVGIEEIGLAQREAAEAVRA